MSDKTRDERRSDDQSRRAAGSGHEPGREAKANPRRTAGRARAAGDAQVPPTAQFATGSPPGGTTTASTSDEAVSTASREASAPSVETTPELERVIAERDDYLDHLRRLQAEFDNYRKRVRRESEELRARAAEGVVEALLPVIDNMERALDAAATHEEGRLVEGVELVASQLRSVLGSYGLEEVPTDPGMPFDPNVHEAVMTQDGGEQPEGTITQVLERGYTLHGRLLRPARVIVAK
jgi:molecular chaperone GrpE